jgi:SAM-dependent methyltransferase
MSYKYYDENAQTFYESSINADMSETLERFLSHLPKGAHILDAGSGTGRDTKYFLDHGYQVTAFDASIEMVKMSTAYTGIQTLHMTFEDMHFDTNFDGIWACASLLHVKRENLSAVLSNLNSLLNNGGVLYCSFKLGESDFSRNGREFTCLTPNQLENLLPITAFKLKEIWITNDVRTGRESEKWVNAIVRPISY